MNQSFFIVARAWDPLCQQEHPLMNQNRFIVAREKGQAPKTKTAGMQPFLLLPPLFPQRDAGGKGWLDNKAQKPASGNRGITAFFGETNALWPGHGTPVPEGKSFVWR